VDDVKLSLTYVGHQNDDDGIEDDREMHHVESQPATTRK